MFNLLVVSLACLAVAAGAPSPGGYGGFSGSGFLGGIGFGVGSGSDGYKSHREYDSENEQQFNTPYRTVHSHGYGGSGSVKGYSNLDAHSNGYGGSGSVKGHLNLGLHSNTYGGPSSIKGYSSVGSTAGSTLVDGVSFFIPSPSHGGYSTYTDNGSQKNKWNSQANTDYRKTINPSFKNSYGSHYSSNNDQRPGSDYDHGYKWGAQENGAWGEKLNGRIENKQVLKGENSFKTNTDNIFINQHTENTDESGFKAQQTLNNQGGKYGTWSSKTNLGVEGEETSKTRPLAVVSGKTAIDVTSVLKTDKIIKANEDKTKVVEGKESTKTLDFGSGNTESGFTTGLKTGYTFTSDNTKSNQWLPQPKDITGKVEETYVGDVGLTSGSIKSEQIGLNLQTSGQKNGEWSTKTKETDEKTLSKTGNSKSAAADQYKTEHSIDISGSTFNKHTDHVSINDKTRNEENSELKTINNKAEKYGTWSSKATLEANGEVSSKTSTVVSEHTGKDDTSGLIIGQVAKVNEEKTKQEKANEAFKTHTLGVENTGGEFASVYKNENTLKADGTKSNEWSLKSKDIQEKVTETNTGILGFTDGITASKQVGENQEITGQKDGVWSTKTKELGSKTSEMGSSVIAETSGYKTDYAGEKTKDVGYVKNTETEIVTEKSNSELTNGYKEEQISKSNEGKTSEWLVKEVTATESTVKTNAPILSKYNAATTFQVSDGKKGVLPKAEETTASELKAKTNEWVAKTVSKVTGDVQVLDEHINVPLSSQTTNIEVSGFNTGENINKNNEENGSWGNKIKNISDSSTTGKSDFVFGNKYESGISHGIETSLSSEKATTTVFGTDFGTSDYKTERDFEAEGKKSDSWGTKIKEFAGTIKLGSTGFDSKEKEKTSNAWTTKDLTSIGGEKSGDNLSDNFEIGSNKQISGENSNNWTLTTKTVTTTNTGKQKLVGNYGAKFDGALTGITGVSASDEHSTITLVNGDAKTGTSSGYNSGHDIKKGEEKSGEWSVTTNKVTKKSGTVQSGSDFVNKNENVVISTGAPVVVEHDAVVLGKQDTKIEKFGETKDFSTGDKKSGVWSSTTKKVTSTIGAPTFESSYGETFVSTSNGQAIKEQPTNSFLVKNSESGYKTGQDNIGGEKSGAWSITTKTVTTTNTGTQKVGGNYGTNFDGALSGITSVPASDDHATVTLSSGNAKSGTSNEYDSGHDFKTGEEKSGAWSVTTKEVTKKSGTVQSGSDFVKKNENVVISTGAPVLVEHDAVVLGKQDTKSEKYGETKDFSAGDKKSDVWSFTTKKVTGTSGTPTSEGSYSKTFESTSNGQVTKEQPTNSFLVKNSESGYKTGQENIGGEKSGAWSITTKTVTTTNTGTQKVGANYGTNFDGTLTGITGVPASDEQATVTLISGNAKSGISNEYNSGHDLKTGEEKSGAWSVTTKEITKNSGTVQSGSDFVKKIENVVVSTGAPVLVEHDAVVLGKQDTKSEKYGETKDFSTGDKKSGVWSFKTKEVTGTSGAPTLESSYGKTFESSSNGHLIKEQPTNSFLVKNSESGYKTGQDNIGEEKSGAWSITTKTVTTTNTGTQKVGGNYGTKFDGALTGITGVPASDEHAAITLISGNAKTSISDGYNSGHDLKTGEEKSGVWSVTTTEVTKKSGAVQSGSDFVNKNENVVISTGAPGQVKNDAVVLGKQETDIEKIGESNDFNAGGKKSGVWSITTKEVTSTSGAPKLEGSYGEKFESISTAQVTTEQTTNSFLVKNSEGGYKTGLDNINGEKSGAWTITTKTVTTANTGTQNLGGNYGAKFDGALTGITDVPASDEHATITLVNGNAKTGTSSGYNSGHDFKNGEEKSGSWSVTTKEVTKKSGTLQSGSDFVKKNENVVISTGAPVVVEHDAVVLEKQDTKSEKFGETKDFSAGDKKSDVWSFTTKKVTGTSGTPTSEGSYSKTFESNSNGQVIKEQPTNSFLVKNSESGYKIGPENILGEKSGAWTITTKTVTTTNTGTQNLGGNYGTKFDGALTDITGVPASDEHATITLVKTGTSNGYNSGFENNSGIKSGNDFKINNENNGLWTITTKKVISRSSIPNQANPLDGKLKNAFITETAPASFNSGSISLGSSANSEYNTEHALKNNGENSGFLTVTTKKVTSKSGNEFSGFTTGDSGTNPVILQDVIKSGVDKAGYNYKNDGDKTGFWTITTKKVSGSSGTDKSGSGFDKEFVGGLLSGTAVPGSFDHSSFNLGNTENGVSSSYKAGHDVKSGGEKNGFWTITTKKFVSGNVPIGSENFGHVGQKEYGFTSNNPGINLSLGQAKLQGGYGTNQHRSSSTNHHSGYNGHIVFDEKFLKK